ncbi:MAG: YggT family protein [Rhodocyclaceae bacterium]|nr:YggT family protein [Rhodocyclaceae bacterium]MBX3668805.1 YggT family protein [Rhodocyclaceae bacterium]
MFNQLLLLILDAVFGFFTSVLLARFYMQWARVSFRNQIGVFVIAVTDWIVQPARRIFPLRSSLDLPTLVCAWAMQVLQSLLTAWIAGMALSSAGNAIVGLMIMGVLEIIRLSVFFLMFVVIVSAVMSWISSYNPLASVLAGIARPFLRPFQRFVPPIGGVDLSPLFLLLLLQMILLLLAWARSALLMLLR